MLSHFSHVQLFLTPWTVACQALLSMGFSRQEYQHGLPFPSPGDLPDPGIEPGLLHCRQTQCRLVIHPQLNSSYDTLGGVGASQVVPVVKNPPASAGDVRDSGSVPGWGRSPGGGHGNSLQYSCLENPMDRGARRATVHGVERV